MPLNSTLNPSETLGRYLLDKNWYSIPKKSVLPRAFMPPADLHLSVFRINSLTLKEIWEIGQKKVVDAMERPKVLYGIADIKVFKVQNHELEVEPDDIPPRHANIVGWPNEKEKQKILAQELAAEANLSLK